MTEKEEILEIKNRRIGILDIDTCEIDHIIIKNVLGKTLRIDAVDFEDFLIGSIRTRRMHNNGIITDEGLSMDLP